MADESAVDKGDLARLEEKIDKVLSLLNGNGQPGVFTRLALLEKWHQDWDSAQQTASSRFWQVAQPFIVRAIDAVILAFVFLVALHFSGVTALFGLKAAP